MIIYAPHHATALDPNADPVAGSDFTQSDIAIISSKRRMMVVMWAFEANLFAIPLMTHTKNGLRNVPSWLIHEYVCLRDVNDPKDHMFINEGIYERLEVTELDKKLSEKSSLRLTTGVTVDFREEIQIMGHLSKQSTKQLHDMWFAKVEVAMKESWKNEP